FQVRVLDAAAQPGVESLGLASGLAALILGVRQRDQDRRDNERTVFRLVFSRRLTLTEVTAFLRTLVGLRMPRGWLLGRDSVVFEIPARPGSIEHRMRVPAERADEVLGQLRAVINDVRASVVPDAAKVRIASGRSVRVAGRLGTVRTDQAEAYAASILG